MSTSYGVIHIFINKMFANTENVLPLYKRKTQIIMTKELKEVSKRIGNVERTLYKVLVDVQKSRQDTEKMIIKSIIKAKEYNESWFNDIDKSGDYEIEIGVDDIYQIELQFEVDSTTESGCSDDETLGNRNHVAVKVVNVWNSDADMIVITPELDKLLIETFTNK